jgi:hypothetical protein
MIILNDVGLELSEMEEAALTDVNWIWTHGPFT